MGCYLIADIGIEMNNCTNQFLDKLKDYQISTNSDCVFKIYSKKIDKIDYSGKTTSLSKCTDKIETKEWIGYFQREKNRYKACNLIYLDQKKEIFGIDTTFYQADFSLENFEYLNYGFAFSRALLDYSGFCLHASAIEIENKVVMFSATRGTGKSTHTQLWQEYFGKDKVSIINDDAPAVRLLEDQFYAYGTPFCGASGINKNMKAPLHAIVFLERGTENRIERLSPKEAVKLLFNHSYHKHCTQKKITGLLDLFHKLIINIPIYKMYCTISNEAVEIAYSEIIGG